MAKHLAALLSDNLDLRAVAFAGLGQQQQQRWWNDDSDEGAEALLNQAFTGMAKHVGKIGAIEERDVSVATGQALPPRQYASNGHNSVITVDPSTECALAVDETANYALVPNVVAAFKDVLGCLRNEAAAMATSSLSASSSAYADLVASFLQKARFAFLVRTVQQYPSVQEFSNTVTRFVHSAGSGLSIGYTLERYCELLAPSCLEADPKNRVDLAVRRSSFGDNDNDVDDGGDDDTSKWIACVCAITPCMETGRSTPMRVYAVCFFERATSLNTTTTAPALLWIRGCIFVCDVHTTATALQQQLQQQ